jgi:hypothetical protein
MYKNLHKNRLKLEITHNFRRTYKNYYNIKSPSNNVLYTGTIAR